MAYFVQLVILGLLAGGIYVAVGVGFGLVWGVLNIVNLSHGALVIIGGYLTWQLFTTFGIDPLLSEGRSGGSKGIPWALTPPLQANI